MSAEPWWRGATIYQIYPRSFMDASGDGVGDLAGIESRLDYLHGLGIDAIWISPFYPSPMADFGYDISNYTDVDPAFGSLADFDRLSAAVHRRGMKLILDFVPNHTSRLHPWFQESRARRDSPRRDWYLWKDGAPDGGPPNNWLSVFGGSAWEYDPATNQYYYHAFLKEQPDLNWRNPQVAAAMCDVLRFWLKRGADGFRVDVMWHLAKDPRFRDEPPNPDWREGMDPYERLAHIHSCDQPDVFGIVARMRETLVPFGEKLLIGEIYLPLERLAAYYGSAAAPGADLPFNFHLLSTPWRADAIARLIARYESLLPDGAWPNWVLGNHDRMRLASRVGQAGARLAALLLLTLRGTPTLYYGDELGLENVPIPAALVQDPWEKNVPGLGLGRDPVRTPMPWRAAPQGGFTAATPWLPLNTDYPARNVETLARDPASILSLYKALLALRRRTPVLQYGAIADVGAAGEVLSYRRRLDDRMLRVALNFSGQGRPLQGHCIFSTAMTAESLGPRHRLAPHEGVILSD